MGDAGGHLAERAEAFLLHCGAVRLTQFVVGGLEIVAEPGIVGGQRNVFAKHPQEFAFAAAEAVRSTAGREQDAHEPVFDRQRSGGGRAEAGLGHGARER